MLSRFLKSISTRLLEIVGLGRLPQPLRRNPWTSLAFLGGLALCGLGVWEMAHQVDREYFREDLVEYENEEFLTTLRSAPVVNPSQDAAATEATGARWSEKPQWPPTSFPAPDAPDLQQAPAADPADGQSEIRTVDFEESSEDNSPQASAVTVRTAEVPHLHAPSSANSTGARAAAAVRPAGHAAWFLGTIEESPESGAENADAGRHAPTLPLVTDHADANTSSTVLSR